MTLSAFGLVPEAFSFATMRLLLLLAAAAACDAALLTCTQRAMALAVPCRDAIALLQNALVEPASLASLAALGPQMTQCCAAMTTFNSAQCFCDESLVALVSSVAGTNASTLSLTLLPIIGQECGFVPLSTQAGGACAASPPPKPPPPAALPVTKMPVTSPAPPAAAPPSATSPPYPLAVSAPRPSASGAPLPSAFQANLQTSRLNVSAMAAAAASAQMESLNALLAGLAQLAPALNRLATPPPRALPPPPPPGSSASRSVAAHATLLVAACALAL